MEGSVGARPTTRGHGKMDLAVPRPKEVDTAEIRATSGRRRPARPQSRRPLGPRGSREARKAGVGSWRGEEAEKPGGEAGFTLSGDQRRYHGPTFSN